MRAYHANKNRNTTVTETRSKKKMKKEAEIYFQKNASNDEFLFERKIQTATDGLQQHYTSLLVKMLKQNALAVSDFITSMNSEINPSSNHRMNCIVSYRPTIKIL